MALLLIRGAGRRKLRINLPREEIHRRLREALANQVGDDPFDCDGTYATIDDDRVTLVAFGLSRERVLGAINRVVGILRRAAP